MAWVQELQLGLAMGPGLDRASGLDLGPNLAVQGLGLLYDIVRLMGHVVHVHVRVQICIVVMCKM